MDVKEFCQRVGLFPNLFIPICLLAGIAGIAGLIGAEFIPSEFVVILIVALVLVMTAFFLVRFLDAGPRSLGNTYHDEIRDLRNEMRSKFKEHSALLVSDEADLIDKVKQRITETATEEYLSELKEKVSESEYRLDISRKGKITLERTYREIDALGRRGTINLVLGVLTALSGVVALTFFVLGDNSDISTPSDFAIEFLPRLSIVMIIEVFSYFFLRLYKSSLSEIKYFQNEATNIEHNFVALEAAIQIRDKELIDKCILAFLATERNPLMSENQTTREIAGEKQEHTFMNMSANHLVKLIEAVRNDSPGKEDRL